MSLKLLFIQSSLMDPGGASVAQRSLINAALRGGYNVSAISFDGKLYPPLGENHYTKNLIQNKNSKISKIGFNKKITKFILDIVEKLHPEFVIVGNVWGYLAVIAAISQIRARKALVVHGAENFCLNSMLTQMIDLSECRGQFGLKCIINKCESPLRFPVKYLLHRYKNLLLKNSYDLFIVHSQFMYSKLCESFNKPIKYIPLSLEHQFESNDKGTVYKSLLFIGTLTWNKGVIELIEAVKILCSEGYDFTINIVGAGVEKKRIEAEIERFGLGRNVKMLGVLSREDVMKEIQRCELVVFPSYFESFGLVALEAMKFNKKLLISKRGALQEIGDFYGNVFYINEIDKEEIAFQIKFALGKSCLVGEWENPYTIDKTLFELQRMINN